MKHLKYLLLFTLSLSNCYAQVDSTSKISKSTSFIPKELKGEVLYVEKYSEIPVAQSIQILSSANGEKSNDEFLENIYAYNLVFRRKINNEIQTVFNEYELNNIATASSRDIQENLKNDIRFVLKAEFTSEDLVKGNRYDASYYIYDQKTNTRYQSFWSLEAFLKSLKSYNWFAENRITDDMEQSVVDDYVERNIPSEPRRRRRMSRSTKVGLAAILGYAALFILNAIFE